MASNLEKYKKRKKKSSEKILENKSKPHLIEKKFFFDNKKLFFSLVFLSVFFTFLVYFNVLNADFLNWDDDRYVTGNKFLEFNWQNLKFYFTNFYFVMYIPLTMVSYMIDFAIDGLNPFVFHLHNLILHLLNTALVFVFVYKLLASKKQMALFYAFFVALFFGIHPLHVESVAWIAERKDVLYTFWFLISLIFYLKFLENQRFIFFLFTFLSFILSLLAKTQAVVLPLVLLVIDLFFNRLSLKSEDLKDFFKFKNLKKLNPLWEKIPFFILSLIFGIIAVWASSTSEPFALNINSTKTAVETSYSFFEKISLASYSFTHYFLRLIVPFNMSAIHPYPYEAGNVPLSFAFYIIFPLVFLVVVLWAFVKRKNLLLFSLLFYFFTIFLVLHIKNFIISEHYTYLPSVGIGILLACALDFFARKFEKYKYPLLISIASFYFIVLSFLSFERIKVFSNSLNFWNDIEKKYPQVIVTYYNRGNYLQKLGDKFLAQNKADSADFYYKKAIEDYNKTISMDNDYIGAWSNRGITKAKLGLYKEAINDFNRVIEIDSTFGDVYSNRGNAFALLGNWQKALDDYNEALKLKPNFADAYYNRAVALQNLNRLNLAIADFNKAISLNSNYLEAYAQRGKTFLLKNKLDSALADFDFVLKVKPQDYFIRYYKALTLLKMNKITLAKQEFDFLKKNYPQLEKKLLDNAINLEKIADYKNDKTLYSQVLETYNSLLHFDDKNPMYYKNMGVIYAKMNNFDKAFEYFDKAINIAPEFYQVYIDKGYAYFLVGNISKALENYNKAISLNPNASVAFYNRAIVYEKLKNYDLAIKDLTKALSLQKNFSKAYFERAKIYIIKKDFVSACLDLKKSYNLGIKQAENWIKVYCKN